VESTIPGFLGLSLFLHPEAALLQIDFDELAVKQVFLFLTLL